MDIVSLVLVVVAAIGGFVAGRTLAPNQQKIKDLESQLAEKQSEHQKYREQVADHIAGSARKFQSITHQYRELYDHLSEGAQQLCERRSIPRELSTSHVDILAVESPASAPQLTDAPQVNEPTIVDVTSSDLSPISDSNQAILDEHKSAHPESADIIDIDSQRAVDDSGQPEQAKDYAIKEKGVINHNSLNRDDVKT